MIQCLNFYKNADYWAKLCLQNTFLVITVKGQVFCVQRHFFTYLMHGIFGQPAISFTAVIIVGC